MAGIVNTHSRSDLFDSEKGTSEQIPSPLESDLPSVLFGRNAEFGFEDVAQSRNGEIQARCNFQHWSSR